MAYLIFGFALGTFIYWIIAGFHRKHTAWISPRYILWVSILLFGLFTYLEWAAISRMFT